MALQEITSGIFSHHPGEDVGLKVNRRFTREDISVFNEVEWQRYDVVITKKDKDTGEIETKFEQLGVEFPVGWAQNDVNIVTSRYFCGKLGAEDREWSFRQLVERVVLAIVEMGSTFEYFKTDEDALIFGNELAFLLLHRYFSFNSPVWFNFGNPYSKPQGSACFILSAEDTMESIIDNVKTEMTIFAEGSGCGSNRSNLRSAKEELSSGGKAMGVPMVNLLYDAGAKVTKSAGKNRRAAKMEILNDNHGDLIDFITGKAKAEKKAHILINNNINPDFSDPFGAYGTVEYQNSNQSVRISNTLMSLLLDGNNVKADWYTIERYPLSKKNSEVHEQLLALTTHKNQGVDKPQGKIIKSPTTNHTYLRVHQNDNTYEFYKIIDTYTPDFIMDNIAESAWVSGDPGLQYHEIINRYHTCKADGEIRASNPCSEYLFLDDTSCNLGSVNLLKFWDEETGRFNIGELRHTVEVAEVAMDIIVDGAVYPTEKIAEKTKAYRTLGIGFANAGALLMRNLIPYNSTDARDLIASLQAVIHFTAYRHSQFLAKVFSPFLRYSVNRESVIDVLELHKQDFQDFANNITAGQDSKRDELHSEICRIVNIVADWPFDPTQPVRNAQVTVIAPTGTISFLLGAETTGIEPFTGLTIYKMLAEGGGLVLEAPSITFALKKLGYTEEEIKIIRKDLLETGSLRQRDIVLDEHLPIFETAFGVDNTIAPEGHVDMVGRVQKFVSGAISKTMNLPATATKEDFRNMFIRAWEHGCKCVALYREDSKLSQPLNVTKGEKKEEKIEEVKDRTATAVAAFQAAYGSKRAYRERLPNTRDSKTHAFTIAGTKGTIKIGFYPDGRIGEVWLSVSKSGSTLRGLLDFIGIQMSWLIQYGVEISDIVRLCKEVRFEPFGMTNNAEIRFAKSIIDYTGRYIELVAANESKEQSIDSIIQDLSPDNNGTVLTEENEYLEQSVVQVEQNGNICPDCGQATLRKTSSTCETCTNCGFGNGCG